MTLLKQNDEILARYAALSRILKLIADETPYENFQEVDYLFGISSSWEFHLVASFLMEKVGLPSNPDTRMPIYPVHELVIQIEYWSVTTSLCFEDSSLDGSTLARQLLTVKF